jgi:hypothetical protein
MYHECRHVLASGKKCEAPALKGTAFCYFHTRLHTLNKTPPKPLEFIEIPALEDRAAIQLTLTQVLRAYATGCIDQKRTYTLLYGLQLAAQNIDRRSRVILPSEYVKYLAHTKDGQELAAEPDDDDDDDD